MRMTLFAGLALLLALGGKAAAREGAAPEAARGTPDVVQAPANLPATMQPSGDAKTESAGTMAAPSAAGAPAPATGTAPSPLIDDHAGPAEALWIRGGYLLYWIKNGPSRAPLVTTGPASGDAHIGDPNTRTLFGNFDFDYGSLNGGDVQAGFWLGGQHVWGLTAGGFLMERRSTSARFASDPGGTPLLALPINDVVNGGAIGYQVAIPGAFDGSIDVTTTTRLWGAEVGVLRNLVARPGLTFDLLAGFRYLDLDEQLAITSRSTQLAGGALLFDPLNFRNPQASHDPDNPTVFPDGSTITIVDRFRTRNQFYGGQAGAQAELSRGGFTLDVATKVAFGPNHQTVNISGRSTLRQPNGLTDSIPSGLFALTGTNAGRTTTNWFVIAPEVNCRAGYRFGERVFVYTGYNFLYLNNVVRPGEHINPNVNTGFVPTTLSFGVQTPPLQPSLLTRRDDFWAQGVSFGMEFKY